MTRFQTTRLRIGALAIIACTPFSVNAERLAGVNLDDFSFSITNIESYEQPSFSFEGIQLNEMFTPNYGFDIIENMRARRGHEFDYFPAFDMGETIPAFMDSFGATIKSKFEVWLAF